jgi:hypothetical protein
MYSVIRKLWLYLSVMYMCLHYVPERAVAALRLVVLGRLRTGIHVPGNTYR